jgi:hypothetical protein
MASRQGEEPDAYGLGCWVVYASRVADEVLPDFGFCAVYDALKKSPELAPTRLITLIGGGVN